MITLFSDVAQRGAQARLTLLDRLFPDTANKGASCLVVNVACTELTAEQVQRLNGISGRLDTQVLCVASHRANNCGELFAYREPIVQTIEFEGVPVLTGGIKLGESFCKDITVVIADTNTREEQIFSSEGSFQAKASVVLKNKTLSSSCLLYTSDAADE